MRSAIIRYCKRCRDRDATPNASDKQTKDSHAQTEMSAVDGKGKHKDGESEDKDEKTEGKEYVVLRLRGSNQTTVKDV
eukprot:3384138-Alexandrium_andersonii.AAC.1